MKRVEAEGILVCGTELWRRMPIGLIERQDAYRAGGRSWRDREYEIALPHRAVAAHIPHPSGWGWSYERCEPVIQHLRTRVDQLRQELGVDPVAALERRPQRPGLLVNGWADDGQDLSAFEITHMLSKVAAGMYQDGEF